MVLRHIDLGTKIFMIFPCVNGTQLQGGAMDGDGNVTAANSRRMASLSYDPTTEDRAYNGWKHFIPFRPGSK